MTGCEQTLRSVKGSMERNERDNRRFPTVHASSFGMRSNLWRACVSAERTQSKWRTSSVFWTHSGSERVSARHFAPTNGYGYDDIGRDTLDRVFAQCSCRPRKRAGPAAVRQRNACNLHSARRALLNLGTRFISITGMNHTIHCWRQSERAWRCAKFTETVLAFPSSRFRFAAQDGTIDFDRDGEASIRRKACALSILQRSRGYAWREALSMAQSERGSRL